MIFCLGENKYASKGTGFQKNYQVFNQQVTVKEWNEIKSSLDGIGIYSTNWKIWWDNASREDKDKILNIKYFDAKIFKGITGIDVKVDDKISDKISKAIKLFTKKNKMKKSKLKKLSSVIQVCDLCGKVDAYKGDKHNCDPEYQESRREAQEYYT